MSAIVDILEERVVAAAGLIADLRARVSLLERELATNLAQVSEEPVQTTPPPQDSSLVEELVRLRAERVVIRDSIRALITEIDRVSW